MFRRKKAKAAATPAVSQVATVTAEELYEAAILCQGFVLANRQPGLGWMKDAERACAERFGVALAPALLARSIAVSHYALMTPASIWVYRSADNAVHFSPALWAAAARCPLDQTRRFQPAELERLAAAMESESAPGAATIQ